jgi:hypothetical protein
MIGATYAVLAPFAGSAQSLSQSLSLLDRVPRQSSPATRRRPLLSRWNPLLHLPAGQFSRCIRSVSCKKPFNTQRLVPAPFNEFYRKCSGPAITLHHAIFSAGALPIECFSLSVVFRPPLTEGSPSIAVSKIHHLAARFYYVEFRPPPAPARRQDVLVPPLSALR